MCVESLPQTWGRAYRGCSLGLPTCQLLTHAKFPNGSMHETQLVSSGRYSPFKRHIGYGCRSPCHKASIISPKRAIVKDARRLHVRGAASCGTLPALQPCARFLRLDDKARVFATSVRMQASRSRHPESRVSPQAVGCNLMNCFKTDILAPMIETDGLDHYVACPAVWDRQCNT